MITNKLTKLSALLLVLLFSISAKANLGGYYYSAIQVDAVVHENNTWEITEREDVVFTEPRHGVYRYIPYTFSLDVEGDNGEAINQKYECKIDDLEVSGGEYTTDDEDNNIVIRIGSEDELVTGPHTYIIKYTLSLPDDRTPDFDFIYTNILGADMPAEINKFTFNITFDKPLPSDSEDYLEVYGGEYGAANPYFDVNVFITENSIYGYADNVHPNNAITIYLPLDAGYFVGAYKPNHLLHYTCFALSILLIVIIIFSALRMKHPHITKVIEFYPPDDICSAEVGTIIDESADTIDITSLIPWMASKGYIAIEEKEENGIIGSKTDLQLTKLKELPEDAPQYQKKFFKMLFKKKATIKLSDIGEKPKEIEAIKKAIQGIFSGKKKLTDIDSNTFWTHLLIVTSTITLGTNYVHTWFDADEFIFLLLLWPGQFIVGYCLCTAIQSTKAITSWSKQTGGLVVRIVGMIICCATYIYVYQDDNALMSTPLVCAFFIANFVTCEMTRRFVVDTEYRAEIMGRLLGFKEFIETAEKPQLESLQHEDPEYYYKILPYAMVFGISKKWANLFKDIEVEQPHWYVAHNSTSLTGYALTSHLTNSLADSTKSAIQVISHDSSSSSGGGYIGGGFSGGGSGGGGGGSW